MEQHGRSPTFRVSLFDRAIRLVLGAVLVAFGSTFLIIPFNSEWQTESVGATLTVVAFFAVFTTVSLWQGISYLAAAFARPRMELRGGLFTVRHPMLFRRPMKLSINDIALVLTRDRLNGDLFDDRFQVVYDNGFYATALEQGKAKALLNWLSSISLPRLSHSAEERVNMLVLFKGRRPLPPRSRYVNVPRLHDLTKTPRGGESVPGFTARVKNVADVRAVFASQEAEPPPPDSVRMIWPTPRDFRIFKLKWLGIIGFMALHVGRLAFELLRG